VGSTNDGATTSVPTAPAHETATTYDDWRESYLATPERDEEFLTLSGEPISPLYTDADVSETAGIGLPGRLWYG